MKTKLIVSFLLAASCTSVAHAGVFLEPYVGYGFGSTKVDSTMPSPLNIKVSADAKSNGMVYGAKLGASFTIVAVGAEFMGNNGSGDFDATLTPGGKESGSGKINGTNLGLFARVGLPMFHASAAYFLSSKAKLTMTDSGGTDLTDDATGSGFKIGAGFTGLPIIAINLDFISLSYNKAKMTMGNFSGDYTDYSAKMNLTMLSISAPLDF